MVIAILILLFLFILIVSFLLRTLPVFGGKPTENWINTYKQSKQWKDDQFQYYIPTSLNLAFWKIPGLIYKQFTGLETRRPSKNIEVLKDQWIPSKNTSSAAKILWFGHSTFIIEIVGKTILVDPMFGQVPAPHPRLGNPRFNKFMPIDPDQLPEIDIVFMSHDHYDHLDYGSILKIKHKVKQFIVPLGVKRHFIRWGIPDDKLIEMDWWQDKTIDGLQLVCAPARHFSGRGIGDRAKSLWCSWILKSGKENIFFSGDSGYGPHFKDIGDRYGPFDFAMLECGQYYKDWSLIHMLPEEGVQAGIDLKAKVIMPIHWGAFTLAFHSWTEPVERMLIKAKELNVEVTTPRIGELIIVNENYPKDQWWKEYL